VNCLIVEVVPDEAHQLSGNRDVCLDRDFSIVDQPPVTAVVAVVPVSVPAPVVDRIIAPTEKTVAMLWLISLKKYQNPYQAIEKLSALRLLC